MRPPGDTENTLMKSLLPLIAMVLTALLFEEKAREVASDTRDTFDSAVAQARDARQSLAQQVKRQPTISLLAAGGLAYALARILPVRQ
jgi:hypothetical protein